MGAFRNKCGEGNGTPLQYSCLENPMDGGAWWATVHGVAEGRTWLSDFTFTFYFHALEKAMATHSSVLAWRIPGTGEPGGLPSIGSHTVGHDWSDLAAAGINGFEKTLICWDMTRKHSCVLRIVTLVFKRSELQGRRVDRFGWSQGLCMYVHTPVWPPTHCHPRAEGTHRAGRECCDQLNPVPQALKPYSCLDLLPELFRFRERNLPHAQHKLPGLSYWKGAF